MYSSIGTILRGIAVAAGIVFACASPSKAVVTDAVVLAIDASGSIGPANFDLQKNAYVNVLGSVIPLDGTVAIGVVQFASTANTVIGMTTINDAADLAALTTAIGGMTFIGGLTDVAGAIDLGASLLAAFDAGVNTVIDVSTDGFQTVAGDPAASAAAAVAGNVDQVNCIGVGAGADCSFIAGAGAFSVVATGFETFEASLESKVVRELRLPEPGTLAVLGLGLLAAVFLQRRRAA